MKSEQFCCKFYTYEQSRINKENDGQLKEVVFLFGTIAFWEFCDRLIPIMIFLFGLDIKKSEKIKPKRVKIFNFFSF